MPRIRARFNPRRPLGSARHGRRWPATRSAAGRAAVCIALAWGVLAAAAHAASATEQTCAEALARPLKTPPPTGPLTARELPQCDALALYYGFAAKPDHAAALQCAYYQRAHPNPQVGDPFAGPGILSMLYANGDGVELEGTLVKENQLLASSIKVTLANPLAPPQKGKRRPAAAP